MLRDLIGGGSYNPGSLAETNPQFDSSYDSMLVAKVVTNGSNVPTVTPLKNLILLAEAPYEYISTFGSNSANLSYTGSNRIRFNYPPGGDGSGHCWTRFTWNWARTPKLAMPRVVVGIGMTTGAEVQMEGVANLLNERNVDRYLGDFKYITDWVALSLGTITSAYAECEVHIVAA
jgi:hypothetical protein